MTIAALERDVRTVRNLAEDRTKAGNSTATIDVRRRVACTRDSTADASSGTRPSNRAGRPSVIQSDGGIGSPPSMVNMALTSCGFVEFFSNRTEPSQKAAFAPCR